jgi:hypothetical protein
VFVPTCFPLGVSTFHSPIQKSNCRCSGAVHAGFGLCGVAAVALAAAPDAPSGAGGPLVSVAVDAGVVVVMDVGAAPSAGPEPAEAPPHEAAARPKMHPVKSWPMGSRLKFMVFIVSEPRG